MYIKYINRVFPTGGMEGVPGQPRIPLFLNAPLTTTWKNPSTPLDSPH